MWQFNNREIATAVWVLLFAVWAVQKEAIRKALARAIQLFFCFKVVAPVGLMLLYSSAAVLILASAGLWRTSQLKDTVVWFVLTAVVLMVRFVTSYGNQSIFRDVLRETVKVTIVLEFLIGSYTFPLAVELVFVPLVTLVAAIDAFAKQRDEYAQVSQITGMVLVVAGLAVLVSAVWRAIADWEALGCLDTARSILLAPLLSLFLCPALYAMVLFSNYELIFIRLQFGTPKGEELVRYARWRILRHAGLNLRKTVHLLQSYPAELMHVECKADVDGLLKRASREQP